MHENPWQNFLSLQIFSVFLYCIPNAKQWDRTTSAYKTKSQNADENKYAAVDCACFSKGLGIHFLSKVWLRTYSLSFFLSFFSTGSTIPSPKINLALSPPLFFIYTHPYITTVLICYAALGCMLKHHSHITQI